MAAVTSLPSSSRFGPRPAIECIDTRFDQAPNERLFGAMCDAYAVHGSIAWSEDLARLMNDFRPSRLRTGLARLIAADKVFSFQWRDATWVPMVQFHRHDLSVDHRIQSVRRELGIHFDGWETASWFVSRNSFLAARRPVDLIDDDLSAVLQAARADRFVAEG